MTYNTKQKSAIINILKNNKDKMISADEITKKLEELEEHVGKTTLYRFLDELVLTKEVRKNYNDLTNKYEYQLKGNMCENHLHLKCIKCGAVIHLECDDTKNMLDSIISKYNFYINQDETTILGFCQKCRGVLC